MNTHTQHDWPGEKSVTSKSPTPTHTKSKVTSHVDVMDPRKKSITPSPTVDARTDMRRSVSKAVLDEEEKKRNASKEYRAPPAEKSHGLSRDPSRNNFDKKVSQGNFYEEETHGRQSHPMYGQGTLHAQRTEDYTKPTAQKSAHFAETGLIREKSQNKQELSANIDARTRKVSANKTSTYEISRPTSYYFNQKRDSHAEGSTEEVSFKGGASNIVPKKKPDYPYFGGPNENIYNQRAAYHAVPSTATTAGVRPKSNTRQTIK